jgi:hypothetical protein
MSEIKEVSLAEVAGIKSHEEQLEEAKQNEVTELISFDQLVLNFLQQHEDAKEDYKKLQTALDNMHYTSTITKISLEELQTKKDHLNKLTGAIEALALYKKHVNPDVTDKDFTFIESEE